ncbi:hypothetical protein ACFOPX_06760 [Helicobacter baculiformis]|uniref:Uncharacterized protein n=1 Tax=Helicobacter baculiformis TaxID=427351 RepID=A0ABV7ZLC2_9HELI|nr:hypothetical protein [Helicobacter baculiformis]
MDLLVQNIKQDDLRFFQELADKLGVSLEVLPAHTPCDHLEVFVNTPADGDTTALEHTAQEPDGYRESSRVCNSYYNPLNTHQRDHRTHTECEQERTHRYKENRNSTSEPFL